MKDTQWYRNHSIQGRQNILLLAFKEEKRNKSKAVLHRSDILEKIEVEEKSPHETNKKFQEATECSAYARNRIGVPGARPPWQIHL